MESTLEEYGKGGSEMDIVEAVEEGIAQPSCSHLVWMGSASGKACLRKSFTPTFRFEPQNCECPLRSFPLLQVVLGGFGRLVLMKISVQILRHFSKNIFSQHIPYDTSTLDLVDVANN